MTQRETILARLRAKVEAGQPIIGGGAGTGLSAKLEEAGGIDLIVIYNSGRFRMAGRGSLAGMMPYGDANAIVMDMAHEVIPVVRRTPVLAGVCGTDPFRRMDLFLAQVEAAGFAGVQNFPTVGLIDGTFRANLEETGMGFGLEVDMIRLASERGLLTTPYAFDPDEATALVEAGAAARLAIGCGSRAAASPATRSLRRPPGTSRPATRPASPARSRRRWSGPRSERARTRRFRSSISCAASTPAWSARSTRPGMAGAGTSRGATGLRIRVRGQVQGVGFRPFVWQLARRLGVSGHVLNDAEGVLIEVAGGALDDFRAALWAEAPPLSRIDAIEIVPCPAPPGQGFSIVASGGAGAETGVTPDAALCPACRTEIDGEGRRAGYAFTNCTECGPRFTILTGLPYDRAQTTMAGFDLCPACREEYDDPGDRRFHAQPVACPDCGPRRSVSFPDRIRVTAVPSDDA